MPTSAKDLRNVPVAVASGPLSAVDADLVVVPWFEDETVSASGGLDGIDAAVGGEIARALGAREFQGKPFETFFTPVTGDGWKASRVALIGAGRRAAADGEVIRKLA